MKIKRIHKLVTISRVNFFLLFLEIAILILYLWFWNSIESNFYLILCFIPLLCKFLLGAFFWTWAHLSDLPNGRYDDKIFRTWFSLDLLFLVWFLIIFIRPYNLAGEVFGYGLRPYAGKSSCTQDSEDLANNNLVYSTQGMFNSRNVFSMDKSYGLCVLNQKWASDSGVPIPGYARSNGDKGAILCNEEKKDGYMFSTGSKTFCGEKTYKTNLAFGLDLSQITTDTQLYELTNASITTCPTTLGAVDVLPSLRSVQKGLGLNVRPHCLQAHRVRRAATTGPSGYDMYLYNEGEPANFLCEFCPGGPEGEPSFWLANEHYSPTSLQLSLDMYIILLSLQVFFLLIDLIIYRSLYKVQSKSNEHKAKKRT